MGGGDNRSEAGSEKTPRTRRRDARRAAHRNQRSSRKSAEPVMSSIEASEDPAQWSAAQIASHFQHITGKEAKGQLIHFK